MNSYLGIALIVGGVSGLMVGTAAVRKRVAIHAETARKIVHVGSGLLALSLPWLFTTWWPVVIACGVSAIGLAVLRHTNWFPVRLREVIGSVDRESGGEFYFPLAIAMLFLLAGADPLLYCIPVLILTFADTAAAVVGLRFGCTHYRSTRGHKSVEGSLAFFVVSFLCTYSVLLRFSDLTGFDSLQIAVAVAVVTMLTEAIATDGLDNLLSPLIALVLLVTSFHGSAFGPWLQIGSTVLLVTAIVTLQRRAREPGQKSFFERMQAYFSGMFVIPVHITIAAVLYLGVASLMKSIYGLETSLFTAYSVIGVCTFFFHLLILRLMDELKDLEVDRVLFCDRPVPSGRVRVSDIKSSLAIASVLFVLTNMAAGPALWVALVLLGYAYLMFGYFFIPEILRRNLLLNLATHNPVVAVLMLYAMVLFGVEYGLSLDEVSGSMVALVIAFYWAPIFAWEISRKIRAPEEENDYVTYSRIFGRLRAVLIATVAQTAALIIGLYFYRTLSLSGLFPGVILLAYVITMAGHIRFVLRPNPRSSKLRPFAEGYVLAVFASGLLEQFFSELFTWS